MKRTLLLGSAWTASAAAAVGLGFLAVSLVNASASPATTPAAAGSFVTSDSPSSSSSASPSTSVSFTGEQATVAGTVYANCAGGTPVLAGAPAAGWAADDSQKPGEFEFESGTQKLEVRVTCDGQTPRFSVEGPRADDSSG